MKDGEQEGDGEPEESGNNQYAAAAPENHGEPEESGNNQPAAAEGEYVECTPTQHTAGNIQRCQWQWPDGQCDDKVCDNCVIVDYGCCP